MRHIISKQRQELLTSQKQKFPASHTFGVDVYCFYDLFVDNGIIKFQRYQIQRQTVLAKTNLNSYMSLGKPMGKSINPVISFPNDMRSPFKSLWSKCLETCSTLELHKGRVDGELSVSSE